MDQPELRFAFGQNWKRFQSRLTDDRITHARDSLQNLLEKDTLEGLRFLDAGSGSGLFSLAAAKLNATVTSVDIDEDSVACTEYLKQREQVPDKYWQVLEGSILDAPFLHGLGKFDVVYSWGVVHHTGQMWNAVDRLIPLVADEGLAVVAIYNDQGFSSRTWTMIKSVYNRLPQLLQPVYLVVVLLWMLLCRFTTTLLAMLLRLVTFRNPFVPLVRWWHDGRSRGMHWWYDHVDWVGGWPFEVSRPCEVFHFFYERGFDLVNMTTTPGSGCNEYVFRRRAAQSTIDDIQQVSSR